MDTCKTNKCKFLVYKGECVAYYESRRQGLSNECPCVNCILRPMCKTLCQERKTYAQYLYDNSKLLYDKGKLYSISTACLDELEFHSVSY